MRERLRLAIARGRAVHAYLLTGADPAGLQDLAKYLAQSLICERRPDGPCGECRACRKVAEGNHPDLHWVRPSGASLKISQMHEMRELSWLRATEAPGKVFVVDQAESMTTEAANSLLRILEEPPGGATFILLSSQPQQLLPTILSRCQRLDANLAEALPEESLRAELRALVARLSEMDELQVMDLAEQWDRDRGSLRGRVLALAGCYRDLLVLQQTGDRELLAWAPDVDWLVAEVGRHRSKALLEALEACEGCLRNLERNANPRLAADVLLFRLRSA